MRVPFVGCAADGQAGPLEAPTGQSKIVWVPAQLASRLAYYKGRQGPGVLGPRGWHCFETYGSGGGNLYVSPIRIEKINFFSSIWKGFAGPVIQLSVAEGGTSGRFQVARIIARIFPAYTSFVQNVIAEGIEPASSFPSGPYPADRLTYRSTAIVEFLTAAHAEGLGTQSWLLKNNAPIHGVAILLQPDTSLLQLSFRLTPETHDLVRAIIEQTERDAARMSY